MTDSAVAWAAIGALAILGCSHDAATSSSAEAGAPPAVSESLPPPPAPVASESAPAPDASADSEPKHYKVVVQTGDSMVGGGLCKALAPRFKAEGTKFVRDVWEAASIVVFDDTDRIPDLMKRYDPDLVLITLGANDLFAKHPEVYAKHIEGIAKKVGDRDCFWIGPPAWKKDNGLIDVIREHASPCKFYDSTPLVLERRPDGIHPTEKGGEVWAAAFWSFLKRGENGS